MNLSTSAHRQLWHVNELAAIFCADMWVVLCGGQDKEGLKHRPQGWSLLHLACATGQPDCAALLIKHDADVQGRQPCAFIAEESSEALLLQPQSCTHPLSSP